MFLFLGGICAVKNKTVLLNQFRALVDAFIPRISVTLVDLTQLAPVKPGIRNKALKTTSQILLVLRSQDSGNIIISSCQELLELISVTNTDLSNRFVISNLYRIRANYFFQFSVQRSRNYYM